MRKLLFLLVLFLGTPFVSAFDPSCFRYSSEISPEVLGTSAGVFDIGSNIHDDVFFVQSGEVLPAMIVTSEKNPPIPYILLESNESPSVLQDSDSLTSVQVNPFLLSKQDVYYTFDLGSIQPKGTLYANISYKSSGNVVFSLSIDGKEFVDVPQTEVFPLDFRYFRITFKKQEYIAYPAQISSLYFLKSIREKYRVSLNKNTPLFIYRSFSCDPALLFVYSSPYFGDTSLPSGFSSIAPIFGNNSLYRNDTDGDGIVNLDDNCPSISNSSQEDRNHNGVGNACSDDDRDGFFGSKDNCPTISNSDQKDLNNNKIGDACEFDSDGDGIPDGVDNAIHDTNPDQKDQDGDRIGDIIDNCNIYNPDQLDLNSNKVGDVCDENEKYKKTHDSDNDGRLDAVDNCPGISNVDQMDQDTDGIGDVCDNCRILKNPDQFDSDKNGVGDMCDDLDHDGIEGWRDNCPTISNLDQKDSDNNTIGNACSDLDRDGIYDSVDNCNAVSNPDQLDIDNDTIGNACDPKDDRMLESNKYVFIGLALFIAFIFLTGIFLLLRKMNSSH